MTDFYYLLPKNVHPPKKILSKKKKISYIGIYFVRKYYFFKFFGKKRKSG